MSLFNVAFYILAIVATVTGLGVVFSKNAAHSALFLVAALVAVAGVYFVVLADFLALVQLLLYAGAVTILLLFALMLTRTRSESSSPDNPQKPLAALVASVFFGIIVYAVYNTPWPVAGEGLRRVTLEDLGSSLFSQWVIPFEVASLVLLVALLGAIIIARTEGRE